jgi:formyl-CoA transferase
MGCFASADGWINVAGPSGRLLRRFCQVVGLPDLPEDPRFESPEARFANRATLNAAIADRLRTKTTAEWVELLADAGVPCGPVYRMDEVFADPQVKHLEMTAAVEHPVLGCERLLRNAVRMTGAGPTVRSPSPDPGDHTNQVLDELGYDDADVQRLRDSGALAAR